MRRTTLLTYAAVAVGIFLVCFVYKLENRYLCPSSDLERVRILGQYRIGESGELKELTPDTLFTDFATETIYIYGRFDRDIPKNTEMIFCIANIGAEVYLNGSSLFCSGYNEELAYISKSEGFLWKTFISQGITTTDNLEIRLRHIYPFAAKRDVKAFIENIYIGYEAALFTMLTEKYALNMLIGIVILSLGLGISIVVIVMMIKKANDMARYAYLALSLISFGLYLWLYLEIASFYTHSPIMNNIMAIVSVALIPATASRYIASYFGKATCRVMHCFFYVSVICICLLPLTLLTKSIDIYDTEYFFSSYAGIFSVAILLCLLYERFVLKNKTSIFFTTAMGFMALCGIIEMLNFFFNFQAPSTYLAIGFISFIVVLIAQMIHSMHKGMLAEADAARFKNELLQNRITILLSQIGPHFLFNSLEAIIALCDTDPQAAKHSARVFAKYLRNNIESISQTVMIPFEKELEHIRQYVFLETMRYGDDVRVEYDIRTQDFLLPTLTIEPLVENAIHHGIMKRKGGGTVTISTYEAQSAYVISVNDNGAGFNANSINNDDREHIGIKNVKNRLAAQCGGSLLIESRAGIGTTVTVTIPK